MGTVLDDFQVSGLHKLGDGEKILEKYENAIPENVHVLTELVGDELEILDPYGGNLQSYGLCYETMRKTIQKLVNLLNES